MVSKNEELTVSEQCRLLEVNRPTLYYKPVKMADEVLEEEGWFRTLKCELIYIEEFDNPRQLSSLQGKAVTVGFHGKRSTVRRCMIWRKQKLYVL